MNVFTFRPSKWWRKSAWLFVVAALTLYSCTEDDNPIIPDTSSSDVIDGAYYGNKNIIIQANDSTVINYGDIVVGVNERDDVVFDQVRTVMSGPKGRHKEHCLNVCGMGAFRLTYYGDTLSIDEDIKVGHVTMINRGTITIHTKRLVEKYVDQLKVDDNDEAHDYQYLVFAAMYGMANDTFINEGKIEIIFDHDPTIVPKVYGMCFSTAKGGTVINEGEIIFRGVGGISTRLRGCASFANNISFTNRGTITMDVEQADDSRVVTMGGDSIQVVNDGIINVSLPGTVFCITRYGTGTYLNNGTINVTYKSNPEQYWSASSGCSLAVLYEPIKPNHVNQPPMINRGNINITMEETGHDNPYRKCYGMWFDLSLGTPEESALVKLNIVNEGNITMNQSGKYEMAEAAFSSQPTLKDVGVNMIVNKWNTTLRDFSKNNHLFVANGANIDLSIAELVLYPEDDYVSETPYSIAEKDIIYNKDATGEYAYNILNYDKMKVSSGSDNWNLVWDKTNKTAALKKK